MIILNVVSDCIDNMVNGNRNLNVTVPPVTGITLALVCFGDVVVEGMRGLVNVVVLLIALGCFIAGVVYVEKRTRYELDLQVGTANGPIVLHVFMHLRIEVIIEDYIVFKRRVAAARGEVTQLNEHAEVT